ncbi:phosphoinositide 3-kinase adapter protein 1 [Biomphalaria glabrata]
MHSVDFGVTWIVFKITSEFAEAGRDIFSFTLSMAAMDDFILLLHATDAVPWAHFISNRLAGPQYNITSISKDVMTKQSQAFPSSSVVDEDASSSSTVEKDAGNAQLDSSKDSSTFRDSGRCSRNAITESSSVSDCINSCKACVVFISPDILDLEVPFDTDVTTLNPSSTVYLLLGVERDETMAYFAEKAEHVSKSFICEIEGSEKSICAAMYNIIQAYENPSNCDEDEKIYEIPPFPVQRNTIVKVFPKQLTEEERDVYVLLQRPAEDDVIAVLDVDMTQEVELTCVCGQLYMFTMPDELQGEIKFKIESQTHCIGSSSVVACDRLQQLNVILKDLVDPASLLLSALNIRQNDLGGLDTTLAFRLQHLASSKTFATMFPCEDALNTSGSAEEPCKLKYPSLLHFAADLNLRLFCSELLHYPGMLGAACTENADGEFPCQIAARKGFTQLERDLIQFVEEIKGFCDDSMSSPSTQSSSPALSPRPPPPTTHTRKSPGYVNDHISSLTSSDYIDMAGVLLAKQSFLDQQTKSDPELMSPSSDFSDNVFDSFSDKSSDQRKGSITDSLSFESGSSLTKACKVLGVGQTEIYHSASSPTVTANQYSMSTPGYDPMKFTGTPKRFSVSSNCESVSSYNPQDVATSEKHRTNKIKSFFNKITGSKKSVSEEDGTRHGLSKSYSNRSNKSSKSVGAESQRSNKKKKFVSDDSQERDSGSFSDEEKSTPVQGKKNSKPKTFKEREKPMMRTLSKRAQTALNEKVDNVPTLPRPERRSAINSKSTFKSFIDIGLENPENF